MGNCLNNTATTSPAPKKKTTNDELPLNRVIEINLNNARQNLQTLQSTAKETGCGVIAVLKGNAYGHGAIQIAEVAQGVGINNFAVATLGEGVELRNHGIEGRIIILGAPIREEFPYYVEFNLDIMCTGPEIATEIIEFGKECGGKLPVHCMLDTGMNRLGLETDTAFEVIKSISEADGIVFTGLCTHMSHSGDYTILQFERYQKVFYELENSGINVPIFHLENSLTLFDDVLDNTEVKKMIDEGTSGLVRCGSAIYGLKANMLPVMTFKAQIRHVQLCPKGTPIGYSRKFVPEEDVLVATLAVGYCDGYPRDLSNQGMIRIGDEQYQVAGLVCMDMMMVNLGPPNDVNSNIRSGDWATLWGTDENDPSVVQISEDLDSWGLVELVTGIGNRCVYVFKDDAPRE